MQLDRTLLNEHDTPIWNEVVDDHFKHMPVYFRKDMMRVHNKSLHIQPGLEINISHEGKAAFVIGRNIYMQSSRQLILFPGCVPHQVFPDASAPYTRSVICLHDETTRTTMDEDLIALLTLNRSCVQYQLQMGTYTKIMIVLQKMDEEMKRQRAGWKRMIHSLLLELTVLLQRNNEMSSFASVERSYSGQTIPNYVDLCCEYIETHLNEELSLQRVAQYFSISPEQLIRSFRREKGMTYYQYVLLQRVTASKDMLLQQPDRTITEIACSLGFTSPTQFGRTFKSITNMTPSDFRQLPTRSKDADPVS